MRASLLRKRTPKCREIVQNLNRASRRLFENSSRIATGAIHMPKGLLRAKCRRRFGTKVVSVGIVRRPISETSAHHSRAICLRNSPVMFREGSRSRR